ncbi:MAG: glutaredoxin family protein [Sulfuricella sp.]|nr:glutaredoxin family protein [Sulfuricella sp.]
MKLAVLFCFLCMFMVFAAQSAEAGTLYKWTDSSGKVHFSDQPPPQSVKEVQEKKLLSQPQEKGQTSYAIQTAARNYPVTLYVTDCGESCAKAREHLTKRGIPFKEKNPSEPEVSEELQKLSGGLEVPVLLIGKSSPVKGYGSETWDAALDVAGYPKTITKTASPTKTEK